MPVLVRCKQGTRPCSRLCTGINSLCSQDPSRRVVLLLHPPLYPPDGVSSLQLPHGKGELRYNPRRLALENMH